MKIWTIAWQDTIIRLRDRNAMILVLLAPLLVSAIMGAALGTTAHSAGADANSIKLIVVNEDKGQSGQTVADALASGVLADMVKPQSLDSLTEAQKLAESGEADAVIHIPPGFTRSINDSISQAGSNQGKPDSQTPEIHLYNYRASASTSILLNNAVNQIIYRASNPQANADRFNIGISNLTDPNLPEPNPFAFFAPSMAIFFLMFTMFDAPRSILTEQRNGTLARLIRTPTSLVQILLGKLCGSYLTGVLQLILLIVASRLIFNLKWGNSLPALIALAVAVVVATSGLGAVIAAFSNTVNQAEALGAAILIVSAGLGGNFFPPDNLPSWLQIFSRMTINRWGVEGFMALTIRGLGFNDILPSIIVLFSAAFILFLLAFWKFQRKLAG